MKELSTGLKHLTSQSVSCNMQDLAIVGIEAAPDSVFQVRSIISVQLMSSGLDSVTDRMFIGRP